MTDRKPDPNGSALQNIPENARATLSQFVAKILEQLSVSAWLPAAALIISVAMVLELANVLDDPPDSNGTLSVTESLAAAVESMANISLGGAGLFIIGIVVVTIIIQSFEFEAIRALEGYWSSNRIVDRWAAYRCKCFRAKHRKLNKCSRKLTRKAWKSARRRLERTEYRRTANGQQPEMTSNVLAILAAEALDKPDPREAPNSVMLSDQETALLDAVDWRQHASAEKMRQLQVISMKLDDYPQDSRRVLPTKLGNVLRASEDKTGSEKVESFVQDLFDELPFSLKMSHDELRGKLNLYCAMVFIFSVTAIVSLLRLGLDHLMWALCTLAFFACMTCLMYRSAVATARAYGSLIESIADWAENQGRIST